MAWVDRGRVLGMDLVEIAPSYDMGITTLVHAERLISNFTWGHGTSGIL